MYYLDHPFRVTTRSSRRPTPLTYEHLRKWTAAAEHFVSITSVEQLTNVNQYLEQQATLYVSNIIQQVVAQIIGDTPRGWVTIKATQDGALKVALDGTLGDTKTLANAKIDIALATDNVIITGESGKEIHLVNIFFTVADELNIIFKDGSVALTGSMDFGGTGEPRGAVIPLGLAPLICSSGESFVITLDDTVQVSGFCQYFKQTPP